MAAVPARGPAGVPVAPPREDVVAASRRVQRQRLATRCAFFALFLLVLSIKMLL